MRAGLLTKKVTVSLGKYMLSSWQTNVWTTSWKLIVCLWGYWSHSGLVLVSNILWIPPLASCNILPFPSCLPLATCGAIWWCLVLVATPQTGLWKQHPSVPCGDALIRLTFLHLWVSFGVSTLISSDDSCPQKVEGEGLDRQQWGLHSVVFSHTGVIRTMNFSALNKETLKLKLPSFILTLALPAWSVSQLRTEHEFSHPSFPLPHCPSNLHEQEWMVWLHWGRKSL